MHKKVWHLHKQGIPPPRAALFIASDSLLGMSEHDFSDSFSFRALSCWPAGAWTGREDQGERVEE